MQAAQHRGRIVRKSLHTAWDFGCVTAIVVLVGARWLRYSSLSAIPVVDRLAREVMVFDGQAFLWPWVYTTSKLPIVVVALVVLAVGFHRRLLAQIATRADGVWRLTPMARSALLAVMLWFQWVFDMNLTMAVVCASSLLLVWLAEHPRVAPRLPRGPLLAAWVVFFGAWLVAGGDPVERIAIVTWAVLLGASHHWLVTRVRAGDLARGRLAAVMAVSLLPATLPLVAPLHGGTHLGDGLAYDFCEVPGRDVVYATVPVCDSVNAGYEECRTGRVVEYGLQTLKPVAEHNYFSPQFHGRLELIECLPDEVQVAVQAAVIDRRAVEQSALAFPVAAPDKFNPMVAGAGMGITIAHDAAHDAVFYTSEWTHRVARLDRRTQQLADVDVATLAHRWFEPVMLEEHTGSAILYTTSVHPGRNRIYLAEWMRGRYAYAIDLTTLRPVARYDVGGGGALGITVDVERDRLFVSSLWGLEVYDLATDRLIARKRSGLGNRPVIVDTARNRLYVGSMVEGKIRILDRDTFDVVGQIPIGIGSRFAHLSSNGKRFFASSTAAHYYWDADALVSR